MMQSRVESPKGEYLQFCQDRKGRVRACINNASKSSKLEFKLCSDHARSLHFHQLFDHNPDRLSAEPLSQAVAGGCVCGKENSSSLPSSLARRTENRPPKLSTIACISQMPAPSPWAI